jgi:transcription antitermination factor NusA-like protein
MRDGRRVPIQTLMKKLCVQQYDDPAPFIENAVSPAQVVLSRTP